MTGQDLRTNDSGGSTDLWSNGFLRLKPDSSHLQSELRDLMRSCASSLGPYLADVNSDSPSCGFTKSDIREVEKHIVDHYKPSKADAPLQLLKTIVVQLNQRLQKCIPLPTLLDKLRADPNLLSKDFPHAQKSTDIWLEAEGKWLNHCCALGRSARCEPIAWEMCIAFAALHAGVLNVGFAVALAEALANPRQYFACSEYRAYGDLQIQGQGGYPLTRWYPDDRTLLLLSRVAQDEVRTAIARCCPTPVDQSQRRRRIAKAIMDGINREFRRLGVYPEFQPLSLRHFLATIALFVRSELSCTLVDFAIGKLPSRSLIPARIGPVNGDPAATAARFLVQAAIKIDGEEHNLPAAYSLAGKAEYEPKWLRRLRSAFSCGDPAEACEIIQALMASGAIDPGGAQLCTLALKLVRSVASTGNKWQFSSVKCCVLTVARRFVISRGGEDPATYGTETLEELYQEALHDTADDSKTPAQLQRAVAWALREYHRHLVTKYKATPLNEAVAFHVAAGPCPVDARVISIEDLFRTIDHIQTAQNTNWTALYRRVALGHLVLIFLGGLRRMEALGLAPEDVSPSNFFEVFIRENQFRGSKTPNAERRIMLANFAYPFTELLDHVWNLYDEAKARGGNLSCGISDDVIVPIIHRALQVATGDKDCHLHTLRHSAAHWMFLRLTLGNLDHVPNLFPHLPLTMRWLQASEMFRKLFFHNDASRGDDAWAVTSTLGHSNPSKVSLRYYVHCLDLLWAHRGRLMAQHRLFD